VILDGARHRGGRFASTDDHGATDRWRGQVWRHAARRIHRGESRCVKLAQEARRIRNGAHVQS